MTDPIYDCPYCDGQLVPLPDHPDLACDQCGRRFLAEMIESYKSAEDAFVQGHHNLATMGKRRIEPRRDPLESDTKDCFRLAHTALSRAMRFQMPEPYRLATIEMMAEITRFFSERGMASRYEAGYWHRLLIEVDDDRVITELDAVLAERPRLPLGPFKHLWAWYRRRRKLRRLRQMDLQIAEVEQIIAFVEPPHIRRRSQHLRQLRG